MPLISGGIAAATGIAKTVSGLVNNAKAKREAKELARTRPKYAISDLAGQELDLAESEAASGGISSRAETAYNNLNDKQFSSSLSAILKGGGSVNNVADVFGESDEGRQRLALLSDQMRVGQIDRLSRARQNMMQQEDKQFEFNEWMPWADRAQANAASRQQAQNDIWSGIGTVAGAGMQAVAGVNNQNQYNKMLGSVFGSTGGGGTQPQSGNRPTSFSQLQGGMTLNPNQMGAGSSYPTIRRQQPSQSSVAYGNDDYFSPSDVETNRYNFNF